MKKYQKFVFGLRKYFKYSISSEEEIEKTHSSIHYHVSRQQEYFLHMLKIGKASLKSLIQSGSDMWILARTLRVKRDYPISTKSGKILPFHIIKTN